MRWGSKPAAAVEITSPVSSGSRSTRYNRR
jgi:hypothetical protein